MIGAVNMSDADLPTEVERYPWYHTLELGDGIVTEAMFDHRPMLDRSRLLPLSGLHCLDVETMDGFWAFEMEHRGAARVTAIGLDDPDVSDWSAAFAAEVARRDEGRALCACQAHARVEGPARHGVGLRPDPRRRTFDLVFWGDLLRHLKDPMTARRADPQRVRWQRRYRQRDRALPPLPRPAAARAARRHQSVGLVMNLAKLVRPARAAAFQRGDAAGPFELRVRSGGPWLGLRGAMRAYL